MKTIEEQIKVMQHFANGGEVEIYVATEGWMDYDRPGWDWTCSNYRIKEEKKTVTIEKWLCKNKLHIYYIVESSDIDSFHKNEKVKLLEIYKVEL